MRVVVADGVPQVFLNTGDYGGIIAALSGVLLAVMAHGGHVSITDNDGNSSVPLSNTGHGGRVDVYGKDGVSYVSLNVEEDGGVVNTINKFGIEKTGSKRGCFNLSRNHLKPLLERICRKKGDIQFLG